MDKYGCQKILTLFFAEQRPVRTIKTYIQILWNANLYLVFYKKTHRYPIKFFRLDKKENPDYLLLDEKTKGKNHEFSRA